MKMKITSIPPELPCCELTAQRRRNLLMVAKEALRNAVQHAHATREAVRQRAHRRCEYCRFPEHVSNLPFHVEHIVASIHRPDNSLLNPAWACPRCNLKKGLNLSTIDDQTGQQVHLFNPRTMVWHNHFAVGNGCIEGITPCGRGTVRLLDMNAENRVAHRRKLIEQGTGQPVDAR
ncbi:MAG: HNH endonuclease [Verrucomicrobia bacterium]|nr:HNH endonuclease [Verrucomicrobiota bacterium]